MIDLQNKVKPRTGSGHGGGEQQGGPDGIAESRRQEALLRTGALQDAILNSAYFSSIATDDKGVIQIFNAGAERMLGFAALDVVNQVTPADISDPQELIARAASLSLELDTPITPGFEALVFKASRGIEDIYELTYIRKDGSRVPAIVSVTALRDAQKDIIGYLLIGTDNTARKQVEAVQALLDQRLRDSTGRLQAILDAVVDGVLTIDEHGNVETLNPAGERIFGYAAAEVVGQNIKMLLPEAWHGEHDDYLEHCRTTGEASIIGVRREVLGRRKGGSTFPLELALNEMRLGGQRRYTGIARDLSERKQALEQLNLFFALSLDILAIWTVDGYFTRVSPAFSKTLGWSAEEILARPLVEFVHPDDRAATIREIEKMASTGENVLQFENRYLHKDGSIRVLSWRSVFYEGGFVFSSARDVTGVREAERAVVATKDAFLATMSHEIRTPLNGLLGMLELLSLWQLDGEQGETLEIARDSGRSLVRIIDDILDFGKIEAGKLEIRTSPVSIHQLLRRTINTFHAVASAKGLTLKQTVDPRISPSLLADPMRVAQILNNLVSNALKFTTEGHVEVRAELLRRQDGADTVRLSVKDTGIGMEPEVQQRLFQPFEQAGAFTAGLYGGTGLGLSISRRLAEMMGSTIEVKSALGEGTTMSVTLTLPISETAPPDLESKATKGVSPMIEASASGAGPLVLAVDDHSTNRTLLARQIAALGLRVQTAVDGREALAIWQNSERGAIALVVTDCNMPHLDGYALSRAIREIEAREGRPRTPVIAWTANVLPAAVALCHAAEMDDILTKPAGLAALKKTLSKWLPNAATATAGAHGAEDENESAVQAAPIDLVELNKIAVTATDRAEILLDFITQTRSDLAGLRSAVITQNLPARVRIAHRMKGSSRMVGAPDLATTCEAMEHAVGEASLQEASAAMDQAMVRLEEYLAQTAILPEEQA
jgi:two-component system, NarL family, sensor histidine kinase EvgS